jgi:hypothetical protein
MEQKAMKLGWCGGRSIKTILERQICDLLSSKGIPHFHRPRRFQVTLEDNFVGAYSPTIIIRGKGREGKTLVIEAIEKLSTLQLKKIASFRESFKQDFFLTVISTSSCYEALPENLADHFVRDKDLQEYIERISN